MSNINIIEDDFRAVFNPNTGYKYRDRVILHLKNLPPGVDKSLLERVIDFLGSTYFAEYSQRLSAEYLSTYFTCVEKIKDQSNGPFNLLYTYTLIAAKDYRSDDDYAKCNDALKLSSAIYSYKIDEHRTKAEQVKNLEKCINKSSISCCEILLKSEFYENETGSIFHNLFFYPLAHSVHKELSKIVDIQLKQTDDLLGLRKIIAILNIFKENEEVAKCANQVYAKINKLISTSSIKQWMDNFHEFKTLTSWTVYLQIAEGELIKGTNPEHAPNNVPIWISNFITPHFKVEVSKEENSYGISTSRKYHRINYKYAPNEKVENFRALVEGSLRDLTMTLNWDNLKVKTEINLVRDEKVPSSLSASIKKWVLS